MIPLINTQPQFCRGRMVSAKITFAIPSTMKSTISSSVSVTRLSPGLRRNSTPTMMNSATETS